MNKNEEKEGMEKYKGCEVCGRVYLLSRLYKVSCWDKWRFIFEPWVCESCLEKVRKLSEKGQIRFKILQRPRPDNLQFLRNGYEG